ncbi:MAG: prepilin peptidase [Patescibacteria group bacterium]
MMNLFWFVIGITAGSVANAIIYRLPRGIVWHKGRSICPNCKHNLSFLDLIPVLSFIFLGAKCRYCKKPIPWRYFIVEMLSGLIFLNFGFLGFMYWMMLIIAFMDWETMLVSDWLVIIWAILVVLNGGTSILGGLVGLGIIGIIWALTRGKAMGAGDIEIAAVLGLWLGFPKIITGLWFAFVIGGIYGAYLLLIKKAGMKSQIPFGPFLLIGGLIAYTYCYGFLCF